MSKRDFNGRVFRSLERSALFLHSPTFSSNLLSWKSAGEGRYYLGDQEPEDLVKDLVIFNTRFVLVGRFQIYRGVIT